MQERTCDVEDCNRVHRARGLCAMHWKRTYEIRPGKIMVACANCGQLTAKSPDTRIRLRFCSYPCRNMYRINHPKFAKRGPSKARLRREAGVMELHPHPDPLMWMRHLIAERTTPRKPRKFFAGTCVICHTLFVDVTTAQTCSRECAAIKLRDDKNEHRQRRRARELAALVTPVNRRAIYERDAWKCQICRCRVLKTLRYPDLMSASIDHIIPLSQGGTHEPANVRLTHFLCNSTRGDRGHAEQLALM